MNRILIVDDKLENLYFLRALLQGHGYEVDEARNGAEALRQARQRPPHLLLSDLLMPVMDGYTLLRQWKLDERLRSIPFVVYTATYTEPKDERLALDLGADGFITKPAEPDTFIARLEEVLTKQANGQLLSSIPAGGDEEVLLKEYNEALIRRLESKMEQLERANRELKSEISARITHQEKIRAQAELLDLAHDAINAQDMNGQVLYWNKGFGRLSGWTAEEALGQSIVGLLQIDPAAYARATEALLEQDQWSGELTLTSKARQTLIVMSRWTLLRDKQGQPKSILVVNTDVTEQKRLEGQFMQVQRLECLGQIAGGIAHGVNNLLTPILMAVPLLREEIVSPHNASLLDTVEENARRGADLVKQLLTIAESHSGQEIPVSPNHLVQEIAAIIQETFPKSITLRSELRPNLWSIVGDPTQLHQVLLNLCVNARDAMQAKGTLTLSAENVMLDECYARMVPEARPGPHVVLQVADTGTGIPPEIVDKIFDPFFTTKAPDQGTGLGLAEVRSIVKNHAGFIQVDNEPGRGTRFKVYLPAAAIAASVSSQSTSPLLPMGRGELILIVDDEAGIRSVTGKTLEKHGYRVLLAKEGSEAVALFVQHRDAVQVVLTDLVMPIMDGAATVRALRAVNSGIKILAVSGMESRAKVTDLAGLPVEAFLHKPYTAESLLVTLQQVLRGNG